MQKTTQNTSKMTKRSGYEEKLKKKMFLHVLAANPPSLMKKEQKHNKSEPCIDNHLGYCKTREKKHFWRFLKIFWGWVCLNGVDWEVV